MGHDVSAASPLIDQSLELAELIAEQSETGKVDLTDLGRRARKLLEASAKPGAANKLF